jgi:hypothetical protein
MIADSIAPIAARDARQPPQKCARRTPARPTSAATRSPRSEASLSRADSPNVNDSSPAPLAPADRCRASIRDCEAAFREVLGLSRSEARALASGGGSAMAKTAPNTPNVLAALKALIETMEGTQCHSTQRHNET